MSTNGGDLPCSAAVTFAMDVSLLAALLLLQDSGFVSAPMRHASLRSLPPSSPSRLPFGGTRRSSGPLILRGSRVGAPFNM